MKSLRKTIINKRLEKFRSDVKKFESKISEYSGDKRSKRFRTLKYSLDFAKNLVNVYEQDLVLLDSGLYFILQKKNLKD